MNVGELYRLSRWYEEYVLQAELRNAVEKVKSYNNSLLREPSNAVHVGNFESSVTRLLEIIKNADLSVLDFDDLAVLKRLHLEHLLLEGADRQLMTLFDSNDGHSIEARLTNYSNALQKSDGVFRSYLQFLPLTNVVTSKNADMKEKVLTRVRFHNDASIENVVNLAKWSGRWNVIAQGYSRVLGQAPEEFEVVGASNGSIIFDLTVAIDVAKMLGETFVYFTSAYASWVTIRDSIKAAEPFKESDIALYEQILVKAEEIAEEKQQKLSEEVAQQVIEKFNLAAKIDGEQREAFERGVKELHRFIDKGGDIAFKSSSDDLSHQEEIKLVNNALKQLKYRSEQKQLEDKSQYTE
ncbi:hypothetical protein MID13_09195 [Vibrio gigantis]|uniref:hypothetical protein n=1 Tax=Vibrio gigantis TaxID=296199 RepID=UPI001EFACDC5|nr:hypothetical protein [Vibrio gigantis]ULN63108.1 hypothetical protein MID13_09195 [Vibrio gigantis]